MYEKDLADVFKVTYLLNLRERLFGWAKFDHVIPLKTKRIFQRDSKHKKDLTQGRFFIAEMKGTLWKIQAVTSRH